MLASLAQVDFTSALGKTTQQLYSSQQSEVGHCRHTLLHSYTRTSFALHIQTESRLERF